MTSCTLGLDIGFSSVGWALIQENGHLQAMGTYIFPEGVDNEKYNKSATEESKNVQRRTARGARRRYDRTRQRTRNLMAVLKANGMDPSELMVLPARTLFGLRERALSEPLTLAELGRVFYHLNQRRGFKSNRKAQVSEDDNGKVASGIKALADAQGGKTLGAYFSSLFSAVGAFDTETEAHLKDNPTERIRQRYVGRAQYQTDFDAIWAAQQQFHPSVLTGGPTEDPKAETLYNLIARRTIFFQRPLKSAKHLVAKCRYFPQKRCAPKSHPVLQTFRVWEQLARLQVEVQGIFRPLLVNEKNTLAAELMHTAKLSKTEIAKRLNLPPRTRFNELPEDIRGHSTNATLAAALGKDLYFGLAPQKQTEVWHAAYFASDNEWLANWFVKHLHISELAAKEAVMSEKLDKKTGELKPVDNIKLEADYARLSVKAARLLTEQMMQGLRYDEAAAALGLHHSYDMEKHAGDRELADNVELLKNNELRSPIVQQAVQETIKVVNAIIAKYGKPERVNIELTREFYKPKKDRETQKRKMDEVNDRRKAFAEFLNSQHLLSRPLDEHSGEIRKYELWLELGLADDDRHTHTLGEFFKEFKRGDIHKFHHYLECNRVCPYTGQHIPLSELFTDAWDVEHIIPYSQCMDDSSLNKTLCQATFNRQHKRNRLPKDYFNTRPGAEWRAFVQRVQVFGPAKRERLLLEEITQGFQNRHLTTTSWIGREVFNRLKTTFRYVSVRKGDLTALLRTRWQLNEFLHDEPDKGHTKNRMDHRHHAIDAAVVAATTQQTFDAFARFVEQYGMEEARKARHTKDLMPNPAFRQEVANWANTLFVAHRKRHRLLGSRRNKVQVGWATLPNGKRKRVYKHFTSQIVRGPLHEETLYGEIYNLHTRERQFVVRKNVESLETLKQVQEVVDPKVRQVLLNYIHDYGHGDPKKAWKALAEAPLRMYSPKGASILIKTVRVNSRLSQEALVPLRPNENPKLFVKPGNNFVMAIYEGIATKGKKTTQVHECEIVSFFLAVQRKRAGLPVVPPTKNGLPLVLTLQKNDMVVFYDKHPDEIQWDNPGWLAQRLYILAKMSSNDFLFVLHNAVRPKDATSWEYKKVTKRIKSLQKLKCIKVRVDRLGDLHPLPDHTQVQGA